MAGAIGGGITQGAIRSAVAQGSQFGLVPALRYSRDYELELTSWAHRSWRKPDATHGSWPTCFRRFKGNRAQAATRSG